MCDERSRIAELISSLKQQRDELALQIHLGSTEAKKEWDKLTAKLEQLSKDYEPVNQAVKESAGDVLASLKLVADEVKNGFDRIRKAL